MEKLPIQYQELYIVYEKLWIIDYGTSAMQFPSTKMVRYMYIYGENVFSLPLMLTVSVTTV